MRMQYDYTHDVAGLPGGVRGLAALAAADPSGDTITGYDSADGAHWTRVGTVQLAGLPSTVQVGLFVASPGYPVTSRSLGGILHGTARPWPPRPSTSWPAGHLAGEPVDRRGHPGP